MRTHWDAVEIGKLQARGKRLRQAIASHLRRLPRSQLSRQWRGTVPTRALNQIGSQFEAKKLIQMLASRDHGLPKQQIGRVVTPPPDHLCSKQTS